MAYVTLLSMIPAMAALFGIMSLFMPLMEGGEVALMNTLKELILQNLVATSSEQAVTFIDETLTKLDVKTLGITGFAGMLASLILLMGKIEFAFNHIFQVSKPRNPLRRFLYFWTALTVGTLVVSVIAGATAGFGLGRLLKELPEHATTGPGLLKLVPHIGLFLTFFFAYKFIPNRHVTAKQAALGALPATFLLNIAGKGYSYYAAFTSYQVIYGALAAIPLFLFWLYLVWLIVLLGALLAWRVGQGLPSHDESHFNEGTTPEEQYRSLILRSLCPFVSLLAICRAFHRDERVGMSGRDLVSHLQLPAPWVNQSLMLLESYGYLAARRDPDQPTDDLSKRYFPTATAAAIGVEPLLKQFFNPAHAWFDQVPSGPELLELVRRLEAQLPRNLAELIQHQPR
jgi:membrane protein